MVDIFSTFSLKEAKYPEYESAKLLGCEVSVFIRGSFSKSLDFSYNNCMFPFLLMKSMLVLTLNIFSIDTVIFKLINCFAFM